MALTRIRKRANSSTSVSVSWMTPRDRRSNRSMYQAAESPCDRAARPQRTCWILPYIQANYYLVKIVNGVDGAYIFASALRSIPTPGRGLANRARSSQRISKDQMPKNNVGRKLAVQPAGGRELKPSVVAYKRERILEDAVSLFFTMGYEAATLDMLAERLHVTKPFLYTYYRNKGHILSAICEVGIKESLAALDTLDRKAGTAVDRLWAALALVANIIIDRYEYITIYQREMMNLDEDDARRILHLRHQFDLSVAKLVKACQRDGFVTLDDAPEMAIWMGGLLSWIPNCYGPGSKRSRETIVKQVVHACMRLIGLG